MGDVRVIFAELRIQRLAHAVQALELEFVFALCQFKDGRNRQRVMRCELRKNSRPQRQQLLRTGDVVQIRHRLAGEHGIAVEPAFLRALDLGVPIGALDEAHHHPPIEGACETTDIIDHAAGALLISLDCQTKPVPAGKRWISEGRRYDVERQFQAVRFLGIDGEIQVIGLCLPRQIDQARDQFGHHPLMADGLEARMQRGEFDRDAGPVGQRTVIGGLADRLDRACIRVEVARGVVGRARAFAEHVEGIAPMMRCIWLRALKRGFDGLAEHEMVAHQPHRLPRRGAHRRRPQPLGQPSDGPLRGLAGLNDARR